MVVIMKIFMPNEQRGPVLAGQNLPGCRSSRCENYSQAAATDVPFRYRSSSRELLHCALTWGLVRPKTEQFSAMAEVMVCDMIKADFNDELRQQWLPLG